MHIGRSENGRTSKNKEINNEISENPKVDFSNGVQIQVLAPWRELETCETLQSPNFRRMTHGKKQNELFSTLDLYLLKFNDVHLYIYEL